LIERNEAENINKDNRINKKRNNLFERFDKKTKETKIKRHNKRKRERFCERHKENINITKHK